MQKRAMFFIDGFNLFYSIRELPNKSYRWLNLDSLCKHLLNKTQLFGSIKYFTAYKLWQQEANKRHQLYVRVLESKGIEVFPGKFKDKDIHCKICGREFTIPEEKQTDVNIALTLMMDAMQDNFDVAFLVSGDTDLLPVIKCLRQHFPSKEIVSVFPINRAPEELKNHAHRHMKIKEEHLQRFQLPDTIDFGNSVIIQRPEYWK